MNVLILGEGAREHALAWKLKQQGECGQIWVHPGNAGIQLAGFPNLGDLQSLPELVAKSQKEQIQLVVVGPETLLEKGFADEFRKAGFWVVGPNKTSAQLETSKLFAKEFMVSAGIPTADYRLFQSPESLNSFTPKGWPWVLKLDGLAAGKGVTIARNSDDVKEFSKKVWEDSLFGTKSHQVVAETFLPGREISYIGFCDGETFVPLESVTDHKKLRDGDEGPNTGGMGTISPSPFFNARLGDKINKRVIVPFLHELKKSQLSFQGILFVGLMIDSSGDPYVLEFNTRFGDPETQCILPRLQTSLLDLLVATANQRLSYQPPLRWDASTSVYVVACTSGYPENPQKGDLISGLDSVPAENTLFFASVQKREGGLVTHGGRVLGIGALGADLVSARSQVYRTLQAIHWPGIHYRKDIGITD